MFITDNVLFANSHIYIIQRSAAFSGKMNLLPGFQCKRCGSRDRDIHSVLKYARNQCQWCYARGCCINAKHSLL